MLKRFGASSSILRTATTTQSNIKKTIFALNFLLGSIKIWSFLSSYARYEVLSSTTFEECCGQARRNIWGAYEFHIQIEVSLNISTISSCITSSNSLNNCF